jgi:hypothetical protein
MEADKALPMVWSGASGGVLFLNVTLLDLFILFQKYSEYYYIMPLPRSVDII